LDIIKLKHLRTLKKCILGKLAATHKDRVYIPVNLPLIRRPIITTFTVSMLKLECNLELNRRKGNVSSHTALLIFHWIRKREGVNV
jgi:hypothetical protein